jgi:hypothetical protein
MSRRAAIILGTVVAAIGAYWITRNSVNKMAARTLSIFISAAGFWATEALPLFYKPKAELPIHGFFGANSAEVGRRAAIFRRF